jgi:DNA repair protein RadC
MVLTPFPPSIAGRGDVAVTRDLVQGGGLLNIGGLDDRVIGGERWVSMKWQRLGCPSAC